MKTAFAFLKARWPILLGAAAVALVYSKALGADLVWDDTFLVKSRAGIGEWHTLVEQLTSPFWQSSGYVLGNNTSFWRPLTSAILWLGGLLFGTSPPGFHALSLLGAAGAAAALFALLSRLLPALGDKAPAAWMALLFAAHPLCAEVTGMIANISDHLALAFLALELALLMDLARGVSRRGALLLVALCSFLACCSKELGVLGALAPLAAWLLVRAADLDDRPRPLASLRPWIAAAAPVVIFLALRRLVIANAVEDGDVELFGRMDLSWQVFALGFGQALEKAILPAPSGFHVFIRAADVPASAWVWSGLALAMLAGSIAAAVVRRRPTLFALGSLIAFALVAPSFLAIRASDPFLVFPIRYFHIPLAGFAIAALPLVAHRFARVARILVPAAVCLLLLLSWIRIDQWKSDVSLFYAEARSNPESAQTLVNLGAALCGRGAYDEAERVSRLLEDLMAATGNSVTEAGAANLKATIAAYRDKDYAAATALLEESLKKDPTVMTNVFLLADVRADAGHPEQAVAIMKKAIEAPWFDDKRKEKLERRLKEFERRAAAASFETDAAAGRSPIDR